MITRKPRADAVLKTLTEVRQQAICDYAAGHTLADVRAWLAADGIKTSAAALSMFLSWRQLRNRLERNQIVADQIIEDLRRDGVVRSEEELARAGQMFFSALAIEQGDAKSWGVAQSVGVKREELALAKQRFQRDTCELFVKWSSDRRAQEIAAEPVSNSEKIEKLGQLMFGEEWK